MSELIEKIAIALGLRPMPQPIPVRVTAPRPGSQQGPRRGTGR